MNLKENTKFELTLEPDATIHIRKAPSKLEPVFPKVELPKVTKQDMKEFFEDLIVVDSTERDKDERLAYILDR